MQRWTNNAVLSAAVDNNDDTNPNNIILTIKETRLYITVVTLSVNDSQKLSKRFSKGFERSVYWNRYKTKSENRDRTNKYRYFLQSHFVRVNRLFVLVYSSQDNNQTRCKTRRYYIHKMYYQKLQPHHQWKPLWLTHWFWQETSWEGEYYTTRCLLDYY